MISNDRTNIKLRSLVDLTVKFPDDDCENGEPSSALSERSLNNRVRNAQPPRKRGASLFAHRAFDVSRLIGAASISKIASTATGALMGKP